MGDVVKLGTWIVDNIFSEWTLAQKIVLALFATAGIAHAAAGEGWIKGVSGYAKQNDFSDLRIALLSDNYIRSQQRLCEMMLAKNRAATIYASKKRTSIQNEIKQLTGEYPPLPTCEELGVR